MDAIFVNLSLVLGDRVAGGEPKGNGEENGNHANYADKLDRRFVALPI